MEKWVPVPLIVALELDFTATANSEHTHNKPHSLLKRATSKDRLTIRLLQQEVAEASHVVCIALVTMKNELAVFCTNEFGRNLRVEGHGLAITCFSAEHVGPGCAFLNTGSEGSVPRTLVCPSWVLWKLLLEFLFHSTKV